MRLLLARRSDLDRARAVAVCLEQELAHVTAERDLLLRDLIHEVTVEADPWDSLPFPEEWVEE